MDSRQEKQQALLHTILGEAAAELPVDIADSGVSELLRTHDFRATLGALIEIGNTLQVSEQFWWNLKKAAEVLDLRDLYSPLRQKRLEAASRSAS